MPPAVRVLYHNSNPLNRGPFPKTERFKMTARSPVASTIAKVVLSFCLFFLSGFCQAGSHETGKAHIPDKRYCPRWIIRLICLTMTDIATDAQRVRTLDDLQDWRFEGTALAVLGEPIDHSLSPIMHNAALSAMAQTQQTFASWRYFKFRVHPSQLPVALERLHTAGFHGINLTVPHKIQALEILGEGAVSNFARTAGAANTLRRATPPGTAAGATPYCAASAWAGDNTDGYGLQQALRHELSFELAGATVLLLGAGGAARAAAVHCLRQGVRNLWLANRTAARLEELVSMLRTVATEGQTVQSFTAEQPPSTLPLSNMAVINATAVGLKASDPSPINLRPFDPKTTVAYDMTYGVENGFARAAHKRNIRFADGLSMLVWQGVRSLEIWTGASVPAHIMQQALLNYQAQKAAR